MWQRKAMAFVTRAHRHLWGKNNEDPLVFLFRQGLKNEFVKQLHLGWNKYGQDRDMTKWGLEPLDDTPSHFRLPAGIVLPYIRNKALLSVAIIPTAEPVRPVLLPGSAVSDFSFGSSPFHPIEKPYLFKGLKTVQDTKGQKGVCFTLK